VANPKKQAQNEKSSRKHAQYAFSSKLKRQKCHKIWKKSNLQKTSPKNKQNSIETSPKTSNPQVLKKNLNSTKKQAQIRGKNARLATLPLIQLMRTEACALMHDVL